MKLKTNFVFTSVNLVPALSITNWGLALGLMMLSIFLVIDGYQLQANNISLIDQQKKLNDKWISVSKERQQQLTRDSFDKLKIRFSTINEITEMKGQDISLILSRLENLIPDQSYLISLNYRSNTDELSLVIESPDVEKLTDFIESLDKDKLFGEISIVRQDHVSRKGQSVVQFEVHIKRMTNMRGV